MKEQIKKHEILKQCAIYSYGKDKTLPSGYKCVKKEHNVLTGFEANVIRNENEVIISIAGTNSTMDLLHSDNAMGIKRLPIQSNDALNLYKKVKEEYPNSEIILTGHSLGGSLAQIVGAINDVETVTFNAYGTKNLFKPEMEIYPDKITNYVNLDDYGVITKNTKNQIGTCYSIGTRGFAKNKHELEGMADLRTREKFNQKTYGIPDRHPQRGPKEIHTGEKTKCNGSYSVSGYTREDGTKVDGYTRTCYVHGGGAIKSYAGKKYSEMSKAEQNQFLEDSI